MLLLMLFACGKPLPTKNVDFSEHIVPLVRQDCSSCHYHGEYGITLKGKESDYEQIILFVNTDSPDASPFLAYPSTGLNNHPNDWPKGTPKYKTVKAWIEEGALLNPSDTNTKETGDTDTSETGEVHPISFENDICPELYRDCKSCHGNGQYGVKLQGTPNDYSEVMRYVDIENPEEQESFLWWASGGGMHPNSWPKTSNDYKMFLQWVNEGAENN